MKKADTIKLLLAMAENARSIWQDFIDNPIRRGDKTYGRQRIEEARTLEDVVRILQKPDYAESLWNIFCARHETEKEAI